MEHKRARALLRRLSRRLALPSVLMGLVVFSFTLLIFGAAVYSAALPALVADAEQGVGIYAQIASGSLVNALTGAGDGSSADSADGAGTSQHAGRVTSSGRVLGGAHSVSGGLTSPDAPQADDEDDTPDDPDATDPDPDDAPGGDAGEEPGGEDPGTETPGGGDTPGGDEEEPSDPAQDQASYEFLLAEFQAIDGAGGYIDQVNECTAAFERDALASVEVRTRHQQRVETIQGELTSHWLTIMNNLSGLSSAYNDAAGDLLAMYRCLNAYLATISSAWRINLSFEDPSAHVDEFMRPLRDAEVNGQNEDLAEFNSYYSEFVL